jgi:tyrosine-protein kinase Etk/Wzc
MKSEGIVDVEMELSSILSRISENQREISSLSTKLDINRSKYELLQRDLAIGKNSSRNNSERFEVIKSSLLEKEMELVRLKRQYTERHPRISTLNEEVSVLKERLKSAKNEGVAEEISELKNEISVFERRLIAHKEIIEKLNQERATLPAKKADITRITGETSILSDLVREFNTKLENLRIIQAEQLSGKMTIIKRASVPRKPIKPYRSMNVLLGSIAGLVLGLFMAFLVESIDVSVSTVEEVETYVNLSVLGLIPYVAVRNQGDEQTFIPDELKTPLPSSRCIAYHEPKSIIAESFRIFRTNLQFSKRKKPNQGIIFTSSLPGEGKTFLAVNTAITYAQLGNKVLLVDMNLRDPEIHDFFGMSKNPGVTDILIGELALSDAINKTIIGNLDVLASGPIPPNPSEIITSVEMANLICKLKKEYDVVIFDSSPIIPVTDAAILSSMLDRTVLVHNAMRSSLMVLQRAKNMLENVNANIDGVVLNQLHSTLFTDTDLPINYYYAKKDKKKR